MARVLLKHQILVIFLLVSFASLQQAKGQETNSRTVNTEDETARYEDELLMNLNTNNATNFRFDENTLDVPQSELERMSYSAERSENYIQLQMNGSGNEAEATQEEGTGNYMDLGIQGDDNVARYLQQGSNNYIMDRVIGSDIYREINQYGSQLGIYNLGRQSTPMIINQRGAGMKIIINGPN